MRLYPTLVIILLSVILAGCQGETTSVFRPDTVVQTTPLGGVTNVAFRQQSGQLPTAIPQQLIDAADAEYLLLTNIYERVTPSVVNIDVVVESPQIGIDHVGGSGFVYDTQGYIVTNAHVIANASELWVTFNDGYLTTAELIGLDTYSDLAVIKVEVDESRLLPVNIGDSNLLRVGERAIAIGNPFGLTSSMTVGIISGLGRQLPSIQLINALSLGGFNNPSIIQVDTDINPGNSGGPLLNSKGEVIGVNTAISTDTGVFNGVGFAVPARTVQRVVPELIARGKVDYAWLGIASLSAEDGYGVAALAEPLKLPVTAGVLIDTVTPDSPAEKAGLRGGAREVVIRGEAVCQGGDIIVAVNGTYVNTMDELVAYLVMNGRPGDTLNMLIVRGDETFELPLTLESRPTSTQNVRCGGVVIP